MKILKKKKNYWILKQLSEDKLNELYNNWNNLREEMEQLSIFIKEERCS